MNALRGYGPALAGALLLHGAALAFLLLGLKSHKQLASPPVPEVVVQLLPPPQLLQPVPIVPPKPRPLPPVAKPMAKPLPAPKEAVGRALARQDDNVALKGDLQAPAPVAPIKPEPPLPVSAPRFDADYLDNPKPVYPLMARRNGDQGKVLLRVHVTAEGRVDEVQVQTSSGVASLDNAARVSVQTWRFVPARQGSQAVAAWVLVPVVFKLEE